MIAYVFELFQMKDDVNTVFKDQFMLTRIISTV